MLICSERFDMKHIIVLGDGTQITADLNGNNYLPDSSVDDELLEDVNLIGMTIDGVIQTDMTCCNHWTDDDGEHIIFRQYSPDEVARQELEAKIEYIAMMGDIDL